jgi:hypothetical protein
MCDKDDPVRRELEREVDRCMASGCDHAWRLFRLLMMLRRES